jgi:hypothetical protein
MVMARQIVLVVRSLGCLRPAIFSQKISHFCIEFLPLKLSCGSLGDPNRLRESPDFSPRFALVLGFERDDAMLGEICEFVGLTGEQERQQSRQVQEVAGDQDLAFFATQPVAQAPRGIVRLKIRRGGEFGQRVAGPPVSMRRLACPKLAAVPDHGRTYAKGRSLIRKSRRSRLANRRQRSA